MTGIEERFDRGAARYDLMVALNPGYRLHLRRAADTLAGLVGPHPTGLRLLDLACGSGASTRALLEATGTTGCILGVDLSQGMLDQALAKRWPRSVQFRQGTAGDLDIEGLGRSSWHGVFAAYLFRNVAPGQRGKALVEAYELLTPGGWLVTQEYSVAGNPRAATVWDMVSWGVIIPLGTVLDANPGLYRYLRRSVHEFDSTTRFMERLADVGFVDVACATVTGWQHGILHTFIARKPA